MDISAINETIVALNQTVTDGSGSFGYFPEGTVLFQDNTGSNQTSNVAYEGDADGVLAWLKAKLAGSPAPVAIVAPEPIPAPAEIIPAPEAPISKPVLGTPPE